MIINNSIELISKNSNNHLEQENLKQNTSQEKLVRDLIPKIIQNSGKIANYRTAINSEYENFLLAKLQEEVLEFQKDKNIEELADILEVLDAIKLYYNFNEKEIIKCKQLKLAEKGSFKNKIILKIPS